MPVYEKVGLFGNNKLDKSLVPDIKPVFGKAVYPGSSEKDTYLVFASTPPIKNPVALPDVNDEPVGSNKLFKSFTTV